MDYGVDSILNVFFQLPLPARNRFWAFKGLTRSLRSVVQIEIAKLVSITPSSRLGEFSGYDELVTI